MKKTLIMSSLFLMTTFSVHAKQDLELNKLSCNQFISAVQDLKQGDKGQMRIASLTSFLYGYIAGQNDTPKFSPKELKQVLNSFKDTCRADGKQKVTNALRIAYKEVIGD